MYRTLLFPLVLVSGLNALAVAQVTPGNERVAAETAYLLHLPEKEIVGLEPLVASAMDVAPRVIEARLQALAAEARHEQSRSVTRPRADIFLDGSYRENSATQDGAFRPYYNVGAEQPLWHWNALDNHKRIADIRKKLAERDYEEARRTLILEIRRQFLDLTLQKLTLAETDASYERQRTALGVSRDRSARGELNADLLASEQLDTRKAAVTRDRQRTAFERALRDFAILNGRESFSADLLPATISVLPATAKILFKPEVPAPVSAQIPAALAREEATLATSRLDQEITRVQTHPMVNLAVGADQGASSGTDQSAVVNYFAGIRVRWNIFDGFSTRSAVKEARVIVRQNEKALNEARVALNNQLRDTAVDLELSLRELEVAEERYSLTSSRLKVDEDLWKTGRLAETEWQTRNAAGATERIALYDLRGGTLLQLSEYVLLRERATKASAEILFP